MSQNGKSVRNNFIFICHLNGLIQRDYKKRLLSDLSLER